MRQRAKGFKELVQCLVFKYVNVVEKHSEKKKHGLKVTLVGVSDCWSALKKTKANFTTTRLKGVELLEATEIENR